MVVIMVGFLWKWMELWRASLTHTVLSKTCRTEEAEASVCCVLVKVS